MNEQGGFDFSTTDDSPCPNTPPCSHAKVRHLSDGRCDYPLCICPKPSPSGRTSRENHQERMRAKALEALTTRAGMSVGEASRVMQVLEDVSHEFCVCCGYKRKAATGAGTTDVLEHLDDLAEVVRNPQRDGDAGDLDIREKHYIVVLRALYRAPNGLTDEELARVTRIFHDSAKGARANLVTAGWVRCADRPKRDSVNGRGMTVWELMPAARRKLDGLAAA